MAAALLFRRNMHTVHSASRQRKPGLAIVLAPND
jgi:hypothetical protein